MSDTPNPPAAPPDHSAPPASGAVTQNGAPAGPPSKPAPPVIAVERSTRPGWPNRQVIPAARPVPPPLHILQAVVAPLVDAAFYRVAYPDVAADGIDPVHHYCRCGWREGRDPSAGFSTRHYLTRYADVAEQGINPLWHFIVIGRHEGRTPVPSDMLSAGAVAALQPLFDAASYTAANPDVVAESEDPLLHYVLFGGKERRAPNRWFDAGFYLAADQELAVSGLNPLLHYALLGRDQGRPARDPAPDVRATLRVRHPAARQGGDPGWPASASLLGPAELQALLAERLPCDRLVVSVSHDAYTRGVGGIQILVADEQARFAEAGAAYLHLAPVLPRLHLVQDGAANPLRGTLDGVEIGCFEPATLIDALVAMGGTLPAARLLVCHCLLGHDPAVIAGLHAALAPERSVFWVHDYSSLCEGFNLLRNDVAYCGAPPPDSLGCRICVHGAGRARHLRGLEALFAAVPFEVVAPSEAALAIWRGATALPHRQASVHPHVAPQLTARRRLLVPEAQRGTRASPVRVAFLGHPATHKGWPAFRRVVEECGEDPSYRFFHLGFPALALDLPVQSVDVRVTARSREAMRLALEEHAIDLVLVLSPWPETFCFVAYEALAAGADILALRQGGNVAATVLETGRGVVFEDVEAVLDFFSSGRAVRYVRLCLRDGNPAGTLRHLGATAGLPAPAPMAPEEPDAAPEPATAAAEAGP